MNRPPSSVRHEFAAEGEPVPLPGGQGTSWRVGDVVLKPLDMPPSELAWQASVLSLIVSDDVRVAPPRRSRTGRLVVDGWTAWPWLEGRHAPRWAQIIDAGERFHDVLRGVPRPTHVLQTRLPPWSDADRVAWGEAAAPATAGKEVDWLLAVRRPLTLPAQLIHGDLSGNVLLAEGRAPAIIDLSPYWRPTRYATAIIVVDAIAWHRASAHILDPLISDDDGLQLLIRAALFRLLCESDPAAGAYDLLLGHLRRRLTAR